MRIRTRWGFKLMAYPLIVIPLIVYVAAQDQAKGFEHGRSHQSESRFESDNPASAAPSMIAFPDRTCWLDLKGMEYFCFRLLEERR